MKTRRLGPDGLQVSAIGYGAPTFKGAIPPGGMENARRIAERAVELGVTLFDTADHGDGNNETVLGQTLAGLRSRVVLCSKFGNLRGVTWGAEGKTVDGSPAYARRSLEASLRRLNTDYLDLYYLHRVDPAIPIEEQIGGMVRLKEAGLIRHIGLCEAAAETIRRAHRVHPVSAVQSEYSLMTREYETGSIPAAEELGIGFVAYYPLGRGFLAGAITRPPEDNRKSVPRFSPDHLPRNLEALESLRAMAAARGASPGQMALAWLLHRGSSIVPIPGTNTLAHLEENIAAASITLEPDEMAAIDALFPPGQGLHGPRFDSDRSQELNI